MLTATLVKDQVIMEKTDKALVLYQKGFGEIKNNMIFLSLYEANFLYEKSKIKILLKDKEISLLDFQKKASRYDKNFFVKSSVFSDLRSRGYVVKSALKFGAEFRVYDKGVLPGKDHAKWIVFPVHEKEKFSWYEFSAKNRVAHSTRKKLLIAVVDEEQKPTYYEVSWIKP
jgi:tRNA-intron endonuclease